MKNTEELVEDSLKEFRRNVVNSQIQLNEGERQYLETLFISSARSLLIKCITELPKVTEDKTRLQCLNSKSIVGYHPIKGEWKHITQIYDVNGTVRYFTNGVEELIKRK